MKKNALILSLVAGMFPASLFAQCCNVFSSNGTAVSSSGGSCVTLAYATTDCLTATSTTAPADADSDGVPDSKDKCPNTAGPAASNGCPAIMVEVWTLFYTQLKDVRFANNSDSLTPASYPKLDQVAMLMQKNPEYTLKVSGYTDSVGTDESNKVLSQKRALSVKNYLISKGVPAPKVVPAAYGEKFPKAPNETESGRSANRRVEFDLFY